MRSKEKIEPVEVGQLVEHWGQLFEVVSKVNWTEDERTAKEVEGKLTNRRISTDPHIMGVLRMTANYKTYSKFII